MQRAQESPSRGREGLSKSIHAIIGRSVLVGVFDNARAALSTQRKGEQEGQSSLLITRPIELSTKLETFASHSTKSHTAQNQVFALIGIQHLREIGFAESTRTEGFSIAQDDHFHPIVEIGVAISIFDRWQRVGRCFVEVEGVAMSAIFGFGREVAGIITSRSLLDG